MKRPGTIATAVALCLAVCLAQTALTNDAILKMAKAGLGEEILLSTIKAQPGRYTTTPDDLVALKGAGVSDKVIAAMIEKASSGAGAPVPAVVAVNPLAAAPKAAPGPVNEVGVYYMKNDAWTDLAPEVVNFKTGGVLKHVGTVGIVKGDINGRVNGEHSRTALMSPAIILVYTPEGVAITEYQLLRLRESRDAREFRTVTGGVMHVSGGATRDLVQFESRKTAPRTYEIALPNLGAGEYGLLPPAGSDSASSSGRIGKIYSFRLISEGSNAAPPATVPAPSPSEQVVQQPAQPAQPVEPAQQAEPVTIKIGDSTDRVVGSMGQPDRIAKVGNKDIYFYKDMKITFVDGKVSDIQ
jgi:hypothetical protein